jgi:hypothetical protein
MKTIIKVLVVFLFMGVFASVSSLKAESKINAKSIGETLRDFGSVYDTLLFKCFYSLDELRPFSIIQFDKISRMYDNKWIPPGVILGKLDEEEREELFSKIVDYIDSFDNDGQKTFVLNKIKNWCITASHYNFMINKMGISLNSIIDAANKVSSVVLAGSTGDIITARASDMKLLDKDKAYISAINYVSSLAFEGQLNFYSELYHQLALISRK